MSWEHNVSLACMAEHRHWKSLGVGVQSGASLDLHTSPWMTQMSWACLSESRFPQLQNEGMNAHLRAENKKECTKLFTQLQPGVNTYMYQVLDKGLKQKPVWGGSSGTYESFGAAMAGFWFTTNDRFLCAHQESIPNCPCPSLLKKKVIFCIDERRKRKMQVLLSSAEFSWAAEKGPTWTMLFLAATTPLLTARGLKRYLWFKLQARAKPQKRGEEGRKHFKSWENCPVFSSAGNLSKHLSSVES